MTYWKNKIVVVTGAGGFIGSHLAERLVESGARTRAFLHYNALGSRGWLDESPVRDQIEVAFGDIRDPDTLAPALRGAEVVFHLAALIGIPYSYRSPQSYIRTNVEGTLNVLQAAAEADVRHVIHTSTSEVYGTARQKRIREDHPLQAQSPYSASKIAADKVAESLHRSLGLAVSTIRPFNAFGPRQSLRAILPNIVCQALKQDRIELGNLEATRDFNYISDTVEGFLRVAESPASIGEVINIGSGREISIRNVAETILRLMGKKLPIRSVKERKRPKDSEVDRLCADNGKARTLIGWQPKVALEDGLQKLIDAIERNLSHYRSGEYAI